MKRLPYVLMTAALRSALALLALATATLVSAQVPCAEDYVMQAGDTLSNLALKYYNDKLAYWAILDATNAAGADYAKIADPDTLEAGWKLCIPSAKDAARLLKERGVETEQINPPAVGGFNLAFVAKHTGSLFNKVTEGANQAAAELGDTVIFQNPATSDVAGQIELIDALIAQKVDAIGVSASDPDALVSSGEKAIKAGIKFISWDSAIAARGRLVHVSQANPELVGRLQVQMLAGMIDYQGEIAILSAGATMTNQNTWIKWMKEELTDAKYEDMQLVTVVYGDDDQQKSYDEAQGLFKSYPNLKGIIAPTAVGIAAAARALTEAGLCGKIALTGLGLPGEMRETIKNGCCQAMAFWNPIDQGYLTTYIMHHLAAGRLAPTAGESFEAGRLGKFTVLDVGGGDLQVFQGPPLQFDATNIDLWASVY